MRRLNDCLFRETISVAYLINLTYFVFSLNKRSFSLHLFQHPRHVLPMLSCFVPGGTGNSSTWHWYCLLIPTPVSRFP